MKPTLKEQCNDVLRHLVSTGAFLFRVCARNSPECETRWAEWQVALEKAERMIEEIHDG